MGDILISILGEVLGQFLLQICGWLIHGVLDISVAFLRRG
jgi:hypothetical protein